MTEPITFDEFQEFAMNSWKEDEYTVESQIASAVMQHREGSWVGYYDPRNLARPPVYVQVQPRQGEDTLWDKCRVSLDREDWVSVGNRHGLRKFMQAWYARRNEEITPPTSENS